MRFAKITVIACIMLITPSLFASVLVIQPNQQDGKDSAISMQHPDTNYGTEPNLWAIHKTYSGNEQRYGLFQFDIASNLTGATIINATFDFYVNTTFFEASNNVTANRILSDWDETSVNWNTRPDYDMSAIGTATLIGNVYPDPAVSLNQPYWASMDITEAVQHWADGTWDNYGFLFKPAGSVNEQVEIFTSDNPDELLHPKLTVEYTAPVPEPAVCLLFLLGMPILRRKLKK